MRPASPFRHDDRRPHLRVAALVRRALALPREAACDLGLRGHARHARFVWEPA